MHGFRTLRDCKRFWMRTVISWTKFWNGTPCWEWIGAKNADGYGIMTRGKRGESATVGAHRISYEAYVSLIPPQFTIDHRCRNRACVNPAHLEAVTRVENIMRGNHPTTVNRDKTHCKNGHALVGTNLKTYSDGRRECRTCASARSLARYHAKRGKSKWKWRKNRV